MVILYHHRSESVDQQDIRSFFLLAPIIPFIPFFLLFLFEHVLFEHLPKFTISWLIVEGSSCYLFEVASACHGPLVMSSQLCVQNCLSNLDIA